LFPWQLIVLVLTTKQSTQILDFFSVKFQKNAHLRLRSVVVHNTAQKSYVNFLPVPSYPPDTSLPR